jgi:hypothetical protein
MTTPTDRFHTGSQSNVVARYRLPPPQEVPAKTRLALQKRDFVLPTFDEFLQRNPGTCRHYFPEKFQDTTKNSVKNAITRHAAHYKDGLLQDRPSHSNLFYLSPSPSTWIQGNANQPKASHELQLSPPSDPFMLEKSNFEHLCRQPSGVQPRPTSSNDYQMPQFDLPTDYDNDRHLASPESPLSRWKGKRKLFDDDDSLISISKRSKTEPEGLRQLDKADKRKVKEAHENGSRPTKKKRVGSLRQSLQTMSNHVNSTDDNFLTNTLSPAKEEKYWRERFKSLGDSNQTQNEMQSVQEDDPTRVSPFVPLDSPNGQENSQLYADISVQKCDAASEFSFRPNPI